MAREYKIGERFEYFAKTYETVEGTGVCENCAFAVNNWRWRLRGMKPCLRPELVCNATERSDGKHVIFKEI